MTTKDKCTICDELGTIHLIELLPDNGVAVECIHENKSHRWAEYGADWLDNKAIPKNQRGNSAEVECPKCKDKGIANHFYEDNTRFDNPSYLVRHEKVPGTWGKNKMQKIRRCYINDKVQRDELLKKLNRYIPGRE